MAADSAIQSVPLDRRERLSALVDGELAADGVAAACAEWRDDAAARSSWNAYHLIGDVLRSDDLAPGPRGSAEFLTALRSRLAAEPVVLAPQALRGRDSRRSDGTAPGRRWAWMAPSAVAAGFVVVAGALVVTRAPEALGPDTQSIPLAVAPTGAAPARDGDPTLSTTLVAEREVVASGQMLRDARLDRYLTAHKQFAGSSALGTPSAFLRSAVADVSTR